MELLFERFLTEERGEWPDIDLDLPSGDQREKAIQYVYQRYGLLGAAMTATSLRIAAVRRLAKSERCWGSIRKRSTGYRVSSTAASGAVPPTLWKTICSRPASI